jgi:hypothetical protein
MPDNQASCFRELEVRLFRFQGEKLRARPAAVRTGSPGSVPILRRRPSIGLFAEITDGLLRSIHADLAMAGAKALIISAGDGTTEVVP